MFSFLRLRPREEEEDGRDLRKGNESLL